MLDELESVNKLTRDLKNASKTLSQREAQYLVDIYYQIQKFRIQVNNQIRDMNKAKEPHEVLTWALGNFKTLENNTRSALYTYAKDDPVGEWALSIVGIGPVIAAGLLAHIKIEKAPTVGHIWSFAGLDPRAEWKKGQKRPWNNDLKRLCWLIGESFVKHSNHENDVYGKLYRQRKAYEEENNEAGKYAEQARTKLEKFRIDKKTDAYKSYVAGKLPPAHINSRAKRWAVKLFLAHLHEVMYYLKYKKLPPNPYPIAILGHADYIGVPNAELVPGLSKARASQYTL